MKISKIIIWTLLFSFLLGNIIIYNHAYKFTNFSDSKGARIAIEKLTFVQKIKILFLGMDNTKPVNTQKPAAKFETIHLQSHEKLEAWLLETVSAKGTVLLFHGYSGNKSGNISYGKAFRQQGYNTLLVDFMGSGGSSGYQTTIGMKESRDVKVAYDYIKEKYPNETIILFGSSMGAVSILKAIKDYEIKPNKIILECPFGTMRTTVKKRFEAMNLPTFPFTDLLLFYGGLQNGFNAYKHNPTEYAKHVKMPSLLLYGGQDKRVTLEEIQAVYQNLNGKKHLKVFEESGHENYLINNEAEWTEEVTDFLLN